MTINRDLFFDLWREHFGRVPASAIITLGLFIDYWEGRGGGTVEW